MPRKRALTGQGALFIYAVERPRHVFVDKPGVKLVYLCCINQLDPGDRLRFNAGGIKRLAVFYAAGGFTALKGACLI